MSKIILHAIALTKRFAEGSLHVDVLKGVNLDVREGECIAIVGVSGSGKSTLLHVLGGLERASSGDIYWDECDVKTLSERERCALRNKHLGFVYQFHHLLPEFSAAENIAMPLLIAKQKPSFALKRAKELLNQVGLKDRADHRLAELSGGERQRVAFARALVMQPQCVLADEPTGNLDASTGHAVFDLMKELQRVHHTSFIIVTHDRELAEKADRVLTLKNGVLLE